MGDTKTMESLVLAEVHRHNHSSSSPSTISTSKTATVSTPNESFTDDSYVGANILGKREIVNYSYETRSKIASLAEELFQLKIKRKILLRKESELDYQVHDLILQEEYKQRSNAMMALSNRKCLTTHHNSNETTINIDGDDVDDVTQMKEARLFNQMMNITSRRNQLLMDLDIERLREEEEEVEILEEHEQLKIALQNLRNNPAAITEVIHCGHNQSFDHITTKNEGRKSRRKIKLRSCFLC